MPPNASSQPSQKPHACLFCTKSFAKALDLKAHCRAKNHLFNCTAIGCSRGFTTQEALAQHKEDLAHKIFLIPSPIRVVSLNSPPRPAHAESQQPPASNSSNASTFSPASTSSQQIQPAQSAAGYVPRTPTPPMRQQQQMPNGYPPASPAQSAAGYVPRTPTPPMRQQQQMPNGYSPASPAAPPASTTAVDAAARNSSPQDDQRWSSATQAQNALILTALTLSCHSYFTLSKNRYRPGILSNNRGPGYSYTPSPEPNPSVPKRKAVALDCEMVGVGGNWSEVGRISAVDVLTGEIILDALVEPATRVTNWRTAYSGITQHAMAAAVQDRRALKGRTGALDALHALIDTNTVLVGHALQNDFNALRMQHWRVIDTAILAQAAVGPGVHRQWGLKTLCKHLLDIDIQNHGDLGHDSIEDAYAAREVALWCISHPEALTAWGLREKEEYLRKMQEQKERQRLRREREAAAAAEAAAISFMYGDSSDYEDSSDGYAEGAFYLS